MASKLDDTATVVDSLPELPNVVDQKKQKQSLLGYLWDTADLSPEERRLLFKVDASVLIFASVSTVFSGSSYNLILFQLGYFIKNLDQVCIP